jgi:hypothetical protein
MLKKTLLNNHKTTVLLDKFEKDNSSKIIQIQGTLTSNIHSRKSSDTPYYAFLRSNNNKHSLAECIKSKCKDCEMPVIFRIKNCDYFNCSK